MGYTVYRPGGTTNDEFEAYSRLLRQSGKDLGKLPRVPEPGTNRRWLYFWDTQGGAEAFAKEMKRRMGRPGWAIMEVESQPSEGPLGPLLVQLERVSSGLAFSLSLLSLALLKSAFPNAIVPAKTFIDVEKWNDYQKSRGNFRDLVQEIMPSMSGLTEDQLRTIGYEVVDLDTKKLLVVQPPVISGQP